MINFQTRASRWLDKRIPEARRFSLNLNNVFIFPSRFGLLFLFLCLGLFLLGTNYQNNLMILLCYFLVSLFLLNLFTAYLNFAKLTFQLGKTQNGFAKSTIQLPIWIEHHVKGANNAHGKLHLGFWRKPPATTVDLDAYANPVYLTLPCAKRGKLSLPRVTISSYYPLGLFRCWTHLAFASDILIYPTPEPCHLKLEQKQTDEGNQSDHHTAPGHDDFDSLSAYRQGEPLHHVAWKQFAKGQGMITKHFADNVQSSGWLKLKPSSTEHTERQLSELCFNIIELTRTGQIFGLDLVVTKIAPNSGVAHQQICLEALARYPGSKEATKT